MSKITSIFSPPKPSAVVPPLPPAPPPVPTREDPGIAERAREVRDAEKRRRGRAASIIAPQDDELGSAPVNRPGLRQSSLLGG